MQPIKTNSLLQKCPSSLFVGFSFECLSLFLLTQFPTTLEIYHSLLATFLATVAAPQ